MTDERQIRVRSGHHPFKRKCWVISLGISVLNFVNLLLKRESAAVVVITAASVFLSLDSCEEIFLRWYEFFWSTGCTSDLGIA